MSGTIRSFFSTCAEPSCGDIGLCLPGCDVAPRGRAHDIDHYRFGAGNGYWTYVGRYKVYVPSRTTLAADLMRHRRASRAWWRAVCVKCMANSFVEGENGNGRDGSLMLFEVRLVARLRKIRTLRDPRRALRRIVPALEKRVVKSLEWLCLPVAERRRINRNVKFVN